MTLTLPALALSLALSVPSVPLAAGQPAPYAGTLSDVETVRAITSRVRACDAEREELRRALAERAPDATGYVIAAGVGALLGAGVTWWALRR